MGKRFLSILLAVVLCLTNVFVVIAAEEETADYAEILLAPGARDTNATHMFQDGRTDAIYVQKDGRFGWEIQYTNGPRQLYMMIDNKFMYNVKDRPIEVEIDYYDEGTGAFAMRYGLQEGVVMKYDLPYVQLTDTKQWKTHTYYLEDAGMIDNVRALESRSVDICIGTIMSGKDITVETVVVGAIRVRYADYRMPVDVDFTEDHPGDNFFPERGDKLTLDIANRYDTTQNLKLRYTVKNDLHEVIYDQTEDVTVNGGETIQKDLSKDVNKFGLYTMDVSNLDENGNVIHTKSFKFALLAYTPYEEKSEFLATGVHTDRREDPAMLHDLYNSGGMGWMRLDSRWDATEQSVGVYTMHAKTDTYVNYNVEHGIETLLILSNKNALRTGGTHPDTPEEYAAYSDYCAFVASHFKGRVKYFEAPNEINFQVTDPKQFYEIQKAAYQGVKRGNPDAVFVGFDLAGVDLAFTEKVFQLGVLDYMDVYSLHVYQNWGSPEDPAMDPQIRPIRELLAKYGKPDMEVWMTEMSWITYDHLTQSKTEREHASYLIRLTAIFQAQDIVDKFFWYEMQNDGRSDTSQESCFGIIRSGEWQDCMEPYPYSAKTAYATMCWMNKLVGTAECVDYKLVDEDTWAVRYKRDDGKDVIILWTTDHKKNLRLNLGCETGELYDMVGNKVCDLSSINGTFSFMLSGEPVFMVGNFPNFEVETSGGIEFDKSYTESVMNDISDFAITKATDEPMTVEIEPFPGVVTLENNGFEGNNAHLKFTLNEDAHVIDYTKQASDREANRIRIKIANGDKVYLIGELQCLANDPIEATFVGTEMYNGTYLNRWQGSATVTNKSVQQNISGKLVIDSPAEMKDFVGEIPFENLPPGETVQLKFNFPEMVEKEIIKMEAHVELDSGYSTDIYRNMNFVYSNYAETKPTIDGNIAPGEWVTGAMRVNKPTPLVAYPNFDKLWGGVDDQSAVCGMLWDEEYCYFYADVTDDIFYQPYFNSNMWMGDGVQLGITDYIGLNMSKRVNAGTADSGIDYSSYTELSMGLTNNGPTTWRHRTIKDRPLSAVENVETAFVQNGNHTIYEMKIPWGEIITPGAEPVEGYIISLSLLFNENDGTGRLGALEYGSGVISYKDTREFVSIVLLKNEN